MRPRAFALGLLLTFALAGCGSAGPPLPPALGSLAGSGAGHRFYEIYDSASGQARGTMLLLHGGSWMDTRALPRSSMEVAALAFRTLGWRVVDVGYSAGNVPHGRGDRLAMLRDVVAFYDQVRRAFPGPVCVYGESAGGHLAAMLATERPSLSCAVLAAAPLDLVTLARESPVLNASGIAPTFGRAPATLSAWSPDRLWLPGVDRTPVFATAASNDTIVPPAQLRSFMHADPAVDGQVIAGASPGAADALPFMHSEVDRVAADRREAQLLQWLNTKVPPSGAGGTDLGQDLGGGCSTAGLSRWRLLLAGDAWQQSSTQGQLIAATRGCSGSTRWLDDGLSLWALPSATTPIATGAQSALTLTSPHPLGGLTVTFRGYLARPADWTVGLFAAGASGSPRMVAGCSAGSCTGGLRLVGTELTGTGSGAPAPGSADGVAMMAFRLPTATTRLAWLLRCVAPQGCARVSAGEPAIFSLYRIALASAR